MKKITFLLSFLLVSFGYSQSLPIDFDDALDANFVGGGGSAFSVIDNSGDMVGQIVGGTDQFNSRIDLALDTYIDMTTSNKTFTFDFYTSEAVVMTGLFQLGAKQPGGVDTFPIEMQFTTDGNIGWQTITLDFNGATNGFPNQGAAVEYGQYAQISVFTNFGDTGTSTYWVDDIAGAANGMAVPQTPEPTDAPPTPPARSAANVISLYGDAYGTALGLNNVPWDDPTSFTEEEVAGNNVLKLSLGTFMGSSLGSVADASGMTHFHMDFWVADDFLGGQVFNPKLSNHAAGAGETNAISSTIALPGDGTQNQTWVSYDVEIETMMVDEDGDNNNAPYERANITEFLITTAGLIGTAYLDNVYLHNNTVLSTDDFSKSSFKAYPNPTQDIWTVKGQNTQIETIRVYDVLGKQVLALIPNSSEAIISSSGLKSGIYFAQIETLSGIDNIRLIKQ